MFYAKGHRYAVCQYGLLRSCFEAAELLKPGYHSNATLALRALRKRKPQET